MSDLELNSHWVFFEISKIVRGVGGGVTQGNTELMLKWIASPTSIAAFMKTLVEEKLNYFTVADEGSIVFLSSMSATTFLLIVFESVEAISSGFWFSWFDGVFPKDLKVFSLTAIGKTISESWVNFYTRSAQINSCNKPKLYLYKWHLNPKMFHRPCRWEVFKIFLLVQKFTFERKEERWI